MILFITLSGIAAADGDDPAAPPDSAVIAEAPASAEVDQVVSDTLSTTVTDSSDIETTDGSLLRRLAAPVLLTGLIAGALYLLFTQRGS